LLLLLLLLCLALCCFFSLLLLVFYHWWPFPDLSFLVFLGFRSFSFLVSFIAGFAFAFFSLPSCTISASSFVYFLLLAGHMHSLFHLLVRSFLFSLFLYTNTQAGWEQGEAGGVSREL